MKLKPVTDYQKPAYSDFRMKCGRILPAGLAVVSALTILSGCRNLVPEQTAGVPPMPESEIELPSSSAENDDAYEWMNGTPEEFDITAAELEEEVCEPELEMVLGDIAYAEVPEE